MLVFTAFFFIARTLDINIILGIQNLLFDGRCASFSAGTPLGQQQEGHQVVQNQSFTHLGFGDAIFEAFRV